MTAWKDLGSPDGVVLHAPEAPLSEAAVGSAACAHLTWQLFQNKSFQSVIVHVCGHRRGYQPPSEQSPQSW